MAAQQGQVPEALRELAKCHWPTKEWGDACAAAEGGGAEGGEARAAELFGRAALGGDLEAMRGLALIKSGLLSTSGRGASWSKQGEFPAEGVPPDRAVSRKLYGQCAEQGGYPDGLPCQLEAMAVELAWTANDLAAALATALAWATGR
mmetsp:Transcript_69228/g.156490  ORF Transcript_69228/g.156490 Transcript_69228/m.156490 type:complete len:148 (-) Transcript_69228:50-493(-)